MLLLATLASTSADAPLCALAPGFASQATQERSTLGAAVYDIETGTVWSGGSSGPYALHSMIKPPLAWAVMTDAFEEGRELTELQRDAIFYMVAWSQNADVNRLLGMIGGLPGLNMYYERLGVPELAALQHDKRWGSGRASPSGLGSLYAALAMSPEVPEPVRDDGLDLLRAVVPEHRWGASIPERRLVGWESLIKTGNYTLTNRDDEYAEATLRADDESLEAAEASEPASPWSVAVDDGEGEEIIVRMNSAAIWLEAPWLGGRPRFIVSIMIETPSSWVRSRSLQNEIGDTLGNAIADRLAGRSQLPSLHCLKRALY